MDLPIAFDADATVVENNLAESYAVAETKTDAETATEGKIHVTVKTGV